MPQDARQSTTPAPTRTPAIAIRHGAPAIAVLLMCLTMTAVICSLVVHFEGKRNQARFDHEADQARISFEEAVNKYLDSLRGPQGLFAASISVERGEWREYVGSVKLSTNYPAMKAMCYIALVKSSALTDFINHTKSDGRPNFTVAPAATRETYRLLTYSEPEESVLGPLGLDWGVDLEMRSALDRACETNEPVITLPLQPLMPNLPAPGSVAVTPVFTNGVPHETAEQRKAAIQGWIAAPIDLAPLVHGLPPNLLANVAIRIYDGSTTSSAAMLYHHDDDPETGAFTTEPMHVALAGRTWTLAFNSNPAFDAGNSDSMSDFVFFAGILVSLLITGITWSLSQTEARAVALANIKTQELHASQSHLKAALEATEDGLWDWDLRTNVVYFSDRWFAMLGYGPNELPGSFKTWESLVHPDSLERTKDRLKDHIDGRTPTYESETQMLHRDGHIVWIASRGRIVERDQQGRPVRMAGKCVDVSRRKAAEAALHASEARLRLFVEHAPAAVAMFDRDARYLMASRRWMLDLDALDTELVGKSHYEVFPKTAPGWRDVFQRCLCGEVLRNDEQPFERRNGVIRWFRSDIRPWYLPNGEAGGVVVFTEDITERKEAEARAAHAAELNRSVLEAASEVAIIATDLKGTITVFNTGAERMLGYTAWEMIDKQTPAVCVLREEVEARLEQLSSRLSRPVDGFELFVTMTQSGKPEEREWTFVRKDGTRLTVNLVVTSRRDVDGKIIGYVGVASDITARKRAEQELLQAKVAAESANRAKSAFLANMSHEIRTPMNGIIGMSDLMLSTGLSKQQLEFAQTIRASGQSLLTVLNDILDFSKIEAGKLVLESVPFGLRESLESVLDLFAEAAGTKKIELAMLIYADTPDSLKGDPSRLRQVLINLIGNAIKFTEKGEIILRVTCVKQDDGHATLKFTVSDTGIGISLEAQRRLFRPFTQADDSMTRRYGGTGLGLAICKQLVEMMNGEISLTSTPGHGTTFSFTADFITHPAPPQKTEESRTELEGISALIVDDNETNRRILQYQLANWKVRELSASSGKQAIAVLEDQLAQGKSIDVMLLDLQMPEMDGITLATQVTADERFRQTKIIVLTSAGWPLDAQQTEAIGVRAWLNKPAKQSALYECIRSVLHGEKPREFHPDKNSAIHTPREEPVLPLSQPRGHVLVVEDNLVNQRVIELQLRRLGFVSLIVGHGKAALEALQNGRFDLIFMDCQMPELDGYETTREIRRQEQATRQHIPIIAMTAHAMDSDRERCLAAGMDDYLSKPVRLDVLAKTIERWLPERNHDSHPPQATAVSNGETMFDAAHLSELCGGDKTTMKELVALFVRETRSRLKQFAELTDMSVVQRVAHTAKGSAAMMGVVGMVGIFRDIEMAAKEHRTSDVTQLAHTACEKFNEARTKLIELELLTADD